MNFLTIKTLRESDIISMRDEIDGAKGYNKDIPNRIEDMSPLPHSPAKNPLRYDLSPEFKINIHNSS